MNQLLNEMELDEASFQRIADLAYRESGLQLVAEKTSMIQSRLRHRLRSLSLANFNEYCDLVCSESGQSERRHMISALTTNVSHFFREKHHFDVLSDHLVATSLARLRSGGRLRIWSAGCSNGQEACSIAMTLIEKIPQITEYDVRILATDIDPKVVEFATAGVYPERLTNGVPTALLTKYFTKETEASEHQFRTKPVIRDMIAFKELNLLSDWPMKQQMDVIFCRNVVIYFDVRTQEHLWPRFRKSLAADGLLFLGHSERISNPELSGFVTDGPTTYRPQSASHSMQQSG